MTLSVPKNLTKGPVYISVIEDLSPNGNGQLILIPGDLYVAPHKFRLKTVMYLGHENPTNSYFTYFWFLAGDEVLSYSFGSHGNCIIRFEDATIMSKESKTWKNLSKVYLRK